MKNYIIYLAIILFLAACEFPYNPSDPINPDSEEYTPVINVSTDLTDCIIITWNEISHTKKYYLYRSVDNNEFINITSTGQLSYRDEDVTGAKIYYYKLQSLLTTGKTTKSSTVKFGHKKLITPENFTASSGDYLDKIKLSWDMVPGADFYTIYRSDLTPDNYKKINTVSNNYYEDNNGLTVNNKYYYFINAYSSTIDSTSDNAYGCGRLNLPPPENIKATTDILTDGIEITFNLLDQTVDEYFIYRDERRDGMFDILVGTTTTGYYKDISAKVGVRYYYQVKAHNTISSFGEFSEPAEGRYCKEYYKFKHVFGQKGTDPGQFNLPSGLALDNEELLYVVDSLNHRIQKFSKDGTFLDSFGTIGIGDTNFYLPSCICISSSGNLYIGDGGNTVFKIFTKNGEFISKFDVTYPPRDITMYNDTYAYTIPGFEYSIYRYTTSFTDRLSWGSQGKGNSQFDNPSGIAVNSRGTVYVVDNHNHRVQVFDTDGQFITSHGGVAEDDAGYFKHPERIFIDQSDDSIYIVDSKNFRVQKFDKDFNLLSIIGTGNEGAAPGEFHNPIDVVVNSEGTMYISDYENNRIQVYQRQ